MDRDTLINVARTSLRTKLTKDIADHLTEVNFLPNTSAGRTTNENIQKFYFFEGRLHVF